MRIFLATVIAMLCMASPAAADPGDADAFTPGRFAVNCVSVIQTEPMPTWHIAEVINDWNAAQSFVRFSNKAEPGCGVVRVFAYDPKTVVNPPGFAWVNIKTPDGQWRDGRGDLTDQWLYNSAEVWLPRTSMKVYRRCGTKQIVAHELGHTMGLFHNDSRRSVMSDPDVYNLKFCGRIQPVDVRALTALYTTW